MPLNLPLLHNASGKDHTGQPRLIKAANPAIQALHCSLDSRVQILLPSGGQQVNVPETVIDTVRFVLNSFAYGIWF